jgi:hypothetical protein
MGHTIIARLPKGKRWQAVVGLLALPEVRVSDVASATTRAAERRLRQLQRDPSVTYCFWLLVRLAAAARGDNFVGEVGRLGIAARPDDTTSQFLARIADRTRVALNDQPASGPFGELAALALRATLRETVGTEGRSLFGNPLEDLEHAFRRHASNAQFGDLARRFFGDFAARMLRYYVDRELAHAVGGGGLATVTDTTAFARALETHARQTAVVVELYAAQWYAKKNWERLGAIGRDDTEAFVAHALQKLEAGLQRGTGR